jgi:eukaryotic-like serine/threonine-protein kinase
MVAPRPGTRPLVTSLFMAQYKELAVKGRGGYADVFTCQRDGDGQHFALKKLKSGLPANAIKRFQQEVRILSKLDHPNIVKVIEYQVATEPYWFVMPLYANSLRDELTSVICNAPRINRVFSAILDGVEYAHREGVIHRDLKPHNVLLNASDELVVSDFGIGLLTATSDSSRFTGTGVAMGSELYMSPEQHNNAKDVDQRTDIYSLGRMLYELYTERLTSAVQNLDRLPPQIRPIVDRCTQYNRADRYQSIAELKDAWRFCQDAGSDEAAPAEAKRLLTELFATPKLPAKVQRLFQILDQNITDLDLVRETLMKVPDESVDSVDTATLKRVIHAFVNHVASQSWGASYEDKIGNKCGNLYMVVSDPIVKADLVFCLLVIGVKRKRQSVLEILSQILQSTMDSPEKAAVIARLRDTPEPLRQNAGQLLEKDNMDRDIADLFK